MRHFALWMVPVLTLMPSVAPATDCARILDHGVFETVKTFYSRQSLDYVFKAVSESTSHEEAKHRGGSAYLKYADLAFGGSFARENFSAWKSSFSSFYESIRNEDVTSDVFARRASTAIVEAWVSCINSGPGVYAELKPVSSEEVQLTVYYTVGWPTAETVDVTVKLSEQLTTRKGKTRVAMKNLRYNTHRSEFLKRSGCRPVAIAIESSNAHVKTAAYTLPTACIPKETFIRTLFHRSENVYEPAVGNPGYGVEEATGTTGLHVMTLPSNASAAETFGGHMFRLSGAYDVLVFRLVSPGIKDLAAEHVRWRVVGDGEVLAGSPFHEGLPEFHVPVGGVDVLSLESDNGRHNETDESMGRKQNYADELYWFNVRLTRRPDDGKETSTQHPLAVSDWSTGVGE